MQEDRPSEDLTLKLTAFQGPFDLLLHLIKELEVDINDIPMSAITDQYLSYIHQMQELDLDKVGEYLVMAATLLEIKSRLLIPIEPDSIEEGEEDQDPRSGLVQQLLIYQQFQLVADALEEKQADRSKYFARPAADLSSFLTFLPLEEGEITLEQLQKSLISVLQAQDQRQPKEREIHQDQVSVTEKIDFIRQQFHQKQSNQTIGFSSLLRNGSRPEIIATFMAILELVRKQVLVFQQESYSDAIQLRLREEGYA
ncbi:segregation and condensation protein A [Facklamia miroungae]|uniref:Segregation and condensation protein A n=1 Tax=Facklamia miroungae TaxID=120956 RepID=A0A1G7PPC0_9LACT|nr:segregation/condensation protein A [Facklamia miroungae]NKZ28759.1 segregation/condensation protein A [Facklamia miroungae]SDF87260.1 condensin subunit ScpA [Facklamia miroungae]